MVNTLAGTGHHLVLGRLVVHRCGHLLIVWLMMPVRLLYLVLRVVVGGGVVHRVLVLGQRALLVLQLLSLPVLGGFQVGGLGVSQRFFPVGLDPIQ